MPGPMTAEPRGVMYFSTPELADLVRELAARRLGLELPVGGTVLWLWSPGLGPVARVEVEHLPNVTRLRPKAER